MVLEVPQQRNSNAAKVQSHVLCNNNNEIFMHSLNFGGKSNLEDRPDKLSIENIGSEKLSEYRTNVK